MNGNGELSSPNPRKENSSSQSWQNSLECLSTGHWITVYMGSKSNYIHLWKQVPKGFLSTNIPQLSLQSPGPQTSGNWVSISVESHCLLALIMYSFPGICFWLQLQKDSWATWSDLEHFFSCSLFKGKLDIVPGFLWWETESPSALKQSRMPEDAHDSQCSQAPRQKGAHMGM